MMKKILLTILTLLVCAPVFSQLNIKRKVADKFYRSFRYYEAARHYGEILKKDSNNLEIKELLAHCYRKMNDSKGAEKWYFEVVNFDEEEGEDQASHKNILYYAQALSMNGNYEESKIWYQIYSDMLHMHKDSLGHYYVEAYDHLDDFYRDSSRYRIDNVPFNSPFADFSPAFYQKGFVFCSARTPKIKEKDLFAWNKTAFLDLYYTQDRIADPVLFNEKLNSKYHEGPLVFFAEHDSVVFTRNNYTDGKYKESRKGINKLKLYFGREKDGEWINIKEFKYNSDEYSTGHPAVSSDNMTLYFVSDMPGTYGGTDIWRCRMIDGKLGKPENLGPEINTANNEMFPFLDEYNNLFFASNGHPGLGGLDIFMAKNENGKFGEPQNMGAPINSSQDDFGIIFDRIEKTGYFSSNRLGGQGDDDVYRLKILPHHLKVLAFNAETEEILSGVEFDVKDVTGDHPALFKRENDTIIRLDTELRTDYGFDLAKAGFEAASAMLIQDSVSSFRSGDTLRIPMKPIQTEPEKTVPDTLERFIVYYDFDRSNIRSDASVTLDKVIKFMEANPKAKILLSSHTDSRANNDYNVRLSQRRSRSAKQYLADRGISSERLQTISKGEFDLAVDCPDGVDCDENKHQLNRRTVVTVVEW